MARTARRCATEGCGARAVRGSPFCRLHQQTVLAPAGTPGAQGAPEDAVHAAESFYTGALSAEEWEDVRRQLTMAQPSTDAEVAVMRVLIRRVMQRIGEDDPLRALPLVRQGVDAICRALRTQRVLAGEGTESLAAAMAVALREIGEELGIGDAAG